jgi:hypothetical protein
MMLAKTRGAGMIMAAFQTLAAAGLAAAGRRARAVLARIKKDRAKVPESTTMTDHNKKGGNKGGQSDDMNNKKGGNTGRTDSGKGGQREGSSADADNSSDDPAAAE